MRTYRTSGSIVNRRLRQRPSVERSAKLYLIRHGRTDWNEQGGFQGCTGPGLNHLGSFDALALGIRLSGLKFDAVYASDLLRARETGKFLARFSRVSLQIDPRLREISQGEWEGLLNSESEAQYPQLFASWQTDPLTVRLPGGETLGELEQRVIAALNEIAANHLGRIVAVVTHKIPIAVLCCHAQGLLAGRFWNMLPGYGETLVLDWPTQRSNTPMDKT